MINLFGSPAGRAINKITSIKLSKSEAAGTTTTTSSTTTTTTTTAAAAAASAVAAAAAAVAVKMKSKSKDRINNTNSISCSSGNSSFCYRSDDVLNLQNRNGTVASLSTTTTTTTTSAAASASASASASTTNINTNTNSLHRDHTVFSEDHENSIKAISGTVGIDTTIGINNNCSNIATASLASMPAQILRNRRYCIASKPEKYINLHKKKVKCWEFLENDKLNNNWSCTSTDEHKMDRFDELIT